MSKANLFEKRYKIVYAVLVALSILASIKMLFAGFGLDEEYVFVMSYRNVVGDDLLGKMWEPHQTSAFLAAFLMRPYHAVFGTEGILLYLRVCTTILHFFVSICLKKCLAHLIDEKYALLLALIYYNTIPKLIMLPEFGIMMVWFLTLLTVFQIYLDLYENRKAFYSVLMGVSMSCMVLSYPSTILLFFFYIALLLHRDREVKGVRRFCAALLFAGTCAVCGILYMAPILARHSLQEILATVRNIPDGSVYELTALNRIWVTAGGAAQLLGRFLLVFLAAAVFYCIGFRVSKKTFPNLKDNIYNILLLAFLIGCARQCYLWIIKNYGYDTNQDYLGIIMFAGLIVYKGFGKEVKRLLFPGIAASILSIVSIMSLTDLSLGMSIPQFCLAAFLLAAGMIDTVSKRQDLGVEKFVFVFLTAWCVTAVVGKGYTMRFTGAYNNVLQSGGMMKYGPAKYCVSSYIGAYAYNRDYEDWQEYIEDGDRVLVVVNQVLAPDTVQYMFRDVEISHYSVLDPTRYDEKLEEYWEIYPEKIPNVIIVDCWYGESWVDPDSYIMHYIEDNFAGGTVTDGSYIRIYRNGN